MTDLFDQWLAHYEDRPIPPLPEPVSGEPDGPIEAPETEVVGLPPHESQPPQLVRQPEADTGEADAEAAGAAAVGHITGRSSDGLAARLPALEPLVEAKPEPLPSTVFFKPRTETRRILAFVLLAWLVSSVFVCLWAWQDRSWTGLGLAATMVGLTLVTWAVRAGTSVAMLTVQGGQLAIEHHGQTVYFDLAAAHTPIEVWGAEGKRDWQVRFLRRNLEPYVVDYLMVDPQEFMRVLRAYRPEL